MKNRLLSMMLAVAMVVSLFTNFAFAADVTDPEKIADYVIFSLTGENKVSAEMKFASDYNGSAEVIAAQYGNTEKLESVEVLATIQVASDKINEYTTEEIVVPEDNTLKIFIWSSADVLTPVMQNPAVVNLKQENPVVKFAKADTASDTYEIGTTVTAGELFDVLSGVVLDKNNINITVDDTVVYEKNAENWKDSTITFNGIGDTTISITDGYYCTSLDLTFTVNPPPSVDKFVAKENLDFTFENQGEAIVKTLGDIFAAIDGAEIDNAGVNAVISGDEICEFVKDETDWTKSTLTFTKAGTITVDITDNNYCNNATAVVTVKDKEPVDKFAAKENLDFTFENQGEAIVKTLGDVFATIDGAEINKAGVNAVISGDEICEFVKDETDWTKSTLTFTKAGTITVDITDNNYCNNTTAVVTVKDKEPVDKFICEENVAYTFENEGEAIVKTLGDIFAAAEGVVINSSKVEVAVEGEICEFVKDEADWTKSTLTFAKAGAVTVSVTDNNYCNTAVVNITVADKEPADKFVAFENLAYEYAGEPIVKTLGDIFSAVEGTNINSSKVEVAVDNEICKYTKDEADWTKSAVTFDGAGTVNITITDKNYCNVETATIVITEKQPVDKFYAKFDKDAETEGVQTDFLYRVGNQNTVALSSLFGALEGAEISEVNVTAEAVNSNVTSTYTKNATDWTKGTLKFAGTGPVKVTISGDKYAKSLDLMLEVVDATNATSAASAKSNNVVLLNNAGLHTIEVSNGYTLYGNGFKLTATSDVMYDAMGVGFVTLKNGTLDNVQIICPNFSYSIIYNSNIKDSANDAVPSDSSNDARGNVRSAVLVDLNSTIRNSYIHGGRAAIFARSGNILIENTTISGGAAANIHAVSASGVTLRDVTMIQKPFQATVHNTSKTVMGLSGLFECDESGASTPLYLEGTFKQDAWINKDYKGYAPSGASSIIDVVLAKTEYLHDIDGDGTNESLNLGFTYIPQSTSGSTNANVSDNRTNKDSVPYSSVNVSATLAKATVYSYKNTNGTSPDFILGDDYSYVPAKQGSAIPVVSFADTSDSRTFETAFNTSNNYWQSNLTVNLDNGNYNFNFANLKVKKNGKELTYTVTENGTSINTASDIALTASGVRNFVLTICDDENYDANGVKDGTVHYHTYNFVLTSSKRSIPEPTAYDTTGGTPLLVVKSKNGDWSCAIPALEGIKIQYWTSADNSVILDLATLTPSSTGKQNGTENYWETSKDGYKLKVSCGYIHDTKQVYGMPVVVNNSGNKMYFTISSTNGYVSTNTASRSVTLTYEFTDPNGKTLTFKKAWQFNYADYKNGTQYSYSDFVNGTLKAASGGGCVTADTLVTLADGSKKRIDSVTSADMLKVWDFEKGEYTIVPSAVIRNHGYADSKVITLEFDDGTVTKAVNEHGYFDADLNKFVLFNEETATDYIGHSFVKEDGNGYKTVKLVNASVKDEYTEVWSILSAYHYNFITDGIFSLTSSVGGLDYFMPFEINDDMKYDEAKMQADIERYGLYSYEELSDYLTYEEYEACNAKIIKVSVGKGIISFEDFVEIINIEVKGN